MNSSYETDAKGCGSPTDVRRHDVSRYDVIWASPSRDVSGTMPIGNGDLGLNVWVEADGDLLVLLGKTDAWDENSINLKLGRLRIALEPNPFVSGGLFRQELNLAVGEIMITAGSPGNTVKIHLWVDANHPVAQIETESDHAITLHVSLETWRDRDRRIETQISDLFHNLSGPDPFPTIVSPDVVVDDNSPDAFVWFHHNAKRVNDGYQINLDLQTLGDLVPRMTHPLLGRTFGAMVQGDGFVREDTRSLVSKPDTQHRISIYALTEHPSTPEKWQSDIEFLAHLTAGLDYDRRRDAHEAWWTEFWSRSEIHVSVSDAAGESERLQSAAVSRAYALCRFLNACGGRGAEPIKYNGSIFTVGTPDDPDVRRWGGPGFWYQNQRLCYWPMLAAGDFDLMQPWFQMYRDCLPLQTERTKKFFGHDGAFFPETMTFWGAEVSSHYGWTPQDQRASPLAECSYVTYYWQNGIEQTLMLLDYYFHTGDAKFAAEHLLPHADAVMQFYDVHYRRDGAGKILFAPAQSLETWHTAVNPLPEIAGLRYILPKLLDLPHTLTNSPQCARWRRLLNELPEIPTGNASGKPTLLPAEQYDLNKNVENPELYAIFPYRIYGVGKPDLDIALNAMEARIHQFPSCWHQDDAQYALLGCTDEAREYVSRRADPAVSATTSRFPAFWDAFNDWIPDIDHGGVLQLALQFMLLQCEGRTLRLLPAWPTEWDVRFKLHAPFETIVEGSVRDGRLSDLRVTPSERAADVIVMPPYAAIEITARPV